MANYLRRDGRVSIRTTPASNRVDGLSYAHRTGPIFVAARLTILSGRQGAQPLVEGREVKMLEMEINWARWLRLVLVLREPCWDGAGGIGASPRSKRRTRPTTTVDMDRSLSVCRVSNEDGARPRIKSSGSRRVEKGDGGLGPWGKKARPWPSPDLPDSRRSTGNGGRYEGDRGARARIRCYLTLDSKDGQANGTVLDSRSWDGNSSVLSDDDWHNTSRPVEVRVVSSGRERVSVESVRA